MKDYGSIEKPCAAFGRLQNSVKNVSVNIFKYEFPSTISPIKYRHAVSLFCDFLWVFHIKVNGINFVKSSCSDKAIYFAGSGLQKG